MHANTTFFHKVGGGLVDARAWTSPLEGAYTRVAKLAILNALDTPALLKIVFNRRPASASYGSVHTRSFLSSDWVDRSESRPQAQWVRSGFLDHICGRWATRIAGDQRLRLCCRCADMGFQSSLFQIDALTNCPIHNTPLIDCCPHCSESTPRYALTAVGFDTPMQCIRCGRGYGCSWTGAAELDLWREPAGMKPLLTLARKLLCIKQVDIEWPQLSSWEIDPSSETPDQFKRLLTFGALPSVGQDASCTETQVAILTRSCTPAIKGLYVYSGRARDRTAIYKAIARHVLREHRLRPWLRRIGGQEEAFFYLHRNSQAVVPRNGSIPPAFHAFAIWSRRFEDSDWSILRRWNERSPTMALRPVILQWPVDRAVDDNTWGHFAWKSFEEDFWTAREWARLTAKLGDPFNDPYKEGADLERRRAAYLELLRVWTPRLSPLVQAWPSGLTQFVWRQGGCELHSLISVNRNARG